MRAFLMACLATVILGAASYFALNVRQQPTGEAFTAHNARTDPSWYWRLASTTSPATPCEQRGVWQWFFVDFRRPSGEPRICADLQ